MPCQPFTSITRYPGMRVPVLMASWHTSQCIWVLVYVYVQTNRANGCIYGRMFIENEAVALLISRSLKQDETTKCDGVPKDL